MLGTAAAVVGCLANFNGFPASKGCFEKLKVAGLRSLDGLGKVGEGGSGP